MAELKLVIIKFDTIEEAMKDADAWGWTDGEWDYETWGKPSEVWCKGSKDGFTTGIPGSLATSEYAAEYIVKACNLFPELVEALEKMLNLAAFEDHAPRPIFKTVKELLIKAKL
jgi:hypothetical protein